MKPEVLLELLEATADQLGIKVSYEPLQTSVVNGGLCRVKGVYRVIVDKRATSEERVATLATALATFDTSELAMPQKVRDVLRMHDAPRSTAARLPDPSPVSVPTALRYTLRRRAPLLLIATALLGGCTRSKPARQLDLDAVRVTSEARLRTDTVGDG